MVDLKDDELLENLDPETARLIFPQRFPHEPVRIMLLYPPLEGEAAERERELAQQASEFEVTTDPRDVNDEPRHRVVFSLEQLDALHDLWTLLDSELEPGKLDIQLNGRRIPLLRDLWLPLLWGLRA